MPAPYAVPSLSPLSWLCRSARITHAPTGMVSIGDGYMMKDEARGQEDK